MPDRKPSASRKAGSRTGKVAQSVAGLAAAAPGDPGSVNPVPPRAAQLPSGLPEGVVRQIVLYPDPRLVAPCLPAGELNFAELRALVADLFRTLYAAGGRGLAAPQIGVSRSLFVMDEGWKRGSPLPVVMIDPQIVFRSRKMAREIEACLSIPGRPVEMRRPAAIRVSCFDLSGIASEVALDGMAARIVQHEIDHLHGRLIVDAPPPNGRGR